jgi:hypothetical protein
MVFNDPALKVASFPFKGPRVVEIELTACLRLGESDLYDRSAARLWSSDRRDGVYARWIETPSFSILGCSLFVVKGGGFRAV